MKRIFTLLVAVGMLTMAQAQPGTRNDRQVDQRNDQMISEMVSEMIKGTLTMVIIQPFQTTTTVSKNTSVTKAALTQIDV